MVQHSHCAACFARSTTAASVATAAIAHLITTMTDAMRFIPLLFTLILATLTRLFVTSAFTNAAPAIDGVDPAIVKVINNDMFQIYPEFKIKVPYGMLVTTPTDALGRTTSVNAFDQHGMMTRTLDIGYWDAERMATIFSFKRFAPNTYDLADYKLLEVRYSSILGRPNYYRIHQRNGTVVEATVAYGILGYTGTMTLLHRYGTPAEFCLHSRL
ncbi:hypothetical protein THASP1DRAFT_23687 [Thamnocephalis sphaerospora]|uniref:Uncharacterized protein n=1 Tax=Thamnocephalis sphaerospora TaxID=78915 RepID=A0A4P9XQI2_9FUNG|nr:hypothetical protein THASP1DRAFT_23687 [Thamnocephalis sphaerospora]|eukprot:RKP08295.1 hypothetical protein THASP1DRAFT_23687 [Thamnocephalis sphaerospora]